MKVFFQSLMFEGLLEDAIPFYFTGARIKEYQEGYKYCRALS
jgi:hypothetical protein